MSSLLSEKNLLKVIKIGLYAALLTPFLAIQKFMFPFITSKVFGFSILIDVIFAFWLILIILFPQYRPKLKSLSIALLCFFGILLLSSALGIDINRSFWSTQERALGVFSLMHFLAFFFTLSVFKKEDWVKYLKFSVLISVVLSIFALLQFINPNLVLKNSGPLVDRPGSFFGNSAFLAAYLIFNIFLSLWFSFRGFLEEKEKKLLPSLFLIAGVFEITILVFVTETRGAMLGLFAGLLALFSYFAFKRSEPGQNKIIKKSSVMILAAIVIFSALFLFTKNSAFWQKMPGLDRLARISLSDTTTQTRLLAWNVAFKSFKERPVLGYGWENFKYPFDKNYDPRLFRFGVGETYWDKPHNVLLEHMVSGGILGLISYLSIFGIAIYYLLRRYDGPFSSAKPFIFAALTAYFIQNIFLFDIFGTYLMFFLTLAFININYINQREESQSTSNLSPATKNILASIILLAVLAPIWANAKILYTNNRQYWIANYFYNDRPEQAFLSYYKARDNFNPYRDQTNADFANLIASVYAEGKLPEPEKRLQEALTALDQTIGKNPNNFSYYIDLADLANNIFTFNPKQLFAVSESSIKKAFELSPRRQQIYYIYSKLKLLQGKKDEAVALLKEAVSLDPLSGDPHFIYGLFLLEIKDSKNGLAEIGKAAKLGRLAITSDEFRILANYYGDLGMYDESLANYKKALELNPDDLDARLKMGIVYYYLGNKYKARESIGEVLQQIPKFNNTPGYQALKPILDDLNL